MVHSTWTVKLFLNLGPVAEVLAASPTSGYKMRHEKDPLALWLENCIVLPKQAFIQWKVWNMKGDGG